MHPKKRDCYEYILKLNESRPVPLQGKTIQVIPKIVTYHLSPGQSYEGVWHVEGMSHENIVATGLYVLGRDTNICGGELMFKRQYTCEENGHYMMTIPQRRNQYANKMIHDGYQPL